ncbi:MAG TPA: hypothetical protein VF904_01930 [Anaeromyxobacteraceae bacterium]
MNALDHCAGALGSVVLLAIATPSLANASGDAEAKAEARNVELVAHHDLNGNGDGGEGLAIQQRADGRRILYLAHEGQKTCLSILDVTNPKVPSLLVQFPSPGPGVTRCNSLGLAGNVLAVANQTQKPGQRPAGMWLLDVSDLSRVQRARGLDDLRIAFFDTSGPSSRGVHWLWFVDGQFAHLSTGSADFAPTHPRDDQFYMVVDVRDPRRPREVGRWWLPGTRMGDACLPGCLPRRQPIDDGFRAHNVEVFPQHRDRAYLGYIDGGAITLDISGLADVQDGQAQRFSPRLVSRLDYSPPFTAWTHTMQPLFERGLATVSDESTKERCEDAPKLIWLVDIRDETNPIIVGTAPVPENVADLCKRGGWFGSHNLHPNLPGGTSAQLRNTFVGSFFNGGVRIYRLVDVALAGAPPVIEEVGFFVPPPPPGSSLGVVQINHVLVDDKRLIYAVDRISGGLYVLRYTGKEPLD